MKALDEIQEFAEQTPCHNTDAHNQCTRQDRDRLLTAVQDVLKLHVPARRNHTSYNSDGTLLAYRVTEDGPCVTCYPAHITQHCEECEDYDDTCEGVEGAVSHPWPCPTVQAVSAALGEGTR